MKTFKNYIKGINPIILLLIISFAPIGIQSCKSDKKQINNDQVKIEKENVVEIITENMEFQMPDTISSGWNTFRYKNLSTQTCLLYTSPSPRDGLLSRMPSSA